MPPRLDEQEPRLPAALALAFLSFVRFAFEDLLRPDQILDEAADRTAPDPHQACQIGT
jgi:hypothetical protein